MKKIIIYVLSALLLLFTTSCRRKEPIATSTPIPPARETPIPSADISTETAENKPVFADITDFESGNNAYDYGFVDYKEGKEAEYQLTAEIADIPESSSKGLFMSGDNQSESLLMYLSKNIVALPNTNYTVIISFDIATNIKSDISQQGNALQTMYIKAGTSSVSFSPIIDSDDFLRSNWNIGKLSTSGTDGRTLGTAEKVNSNDDSYQFKGFSQSFRMKTSDDGLVCIFIAAQTGIPGISSIYFDNIVIEIAEE